LKVKGSEGGDIVKQWRGVRVNVGICERDPLHLSLLRDMGMPFKFPIIVITDNIGATFMAENESSDVITRHIDMMK
jgi:hypothetical protein